MKKRVLLLLFCFVLYTVLIPVGTLAQDARANILSGDIQTTKETNVIPPQPVADEDMAYEVWVNGVQVTGMNEKDVLEDGTVSFLLNENTLYYTNLILKKQNSPNEFCFFIL